MDKVQFVNALGKLLAQTDFGIKGARYEYGGYDETAIVELWNGQELVVPVAGDSNAMIISDVLRKLEAHIGY